MAEPRRVLLAWDVGAHGIWWVLTKEEMEAAAPRGGWSGSPPPEQHRPKPWSDRLSSDLLGELQAWNDARDARDPDSEVLGQRGRDLAVRVQDELGTIGWEVLYQIDDRVYRVRPPGSWPMATWRQELLGYRPRVPPPDEHPTS